MNDFTTIAERAFALIIVVVFFYLIYSKVRRRTMGETWDEIKSWVGK